MSDNLPYRDNLPYPPTLSPVRLRLSCPETVSLCPSRPTFSKLRFSSEDAPTPPGISGMGLGESPRNRTR